MHVSSYSPPLPRLAVVLLALALIVSCTPQQQNDSQKQVQQAVSAIPSPVKAGAADAALTAAVAGAIAAQTGVNVFHVAPQVHDGVITLKGTAKTAAVKSTILSAVRDVQGVKRIIDKIEIRP